MQVHKYVQEIYLGVVQMVHARAIAIANSCEKDARTAPFPQALLPGCSPGLFSRAVLPGCSPGLFSRAVLPGPSRGPFLLRPELCRSARSGQWGRWGRWVRADA